MGLNYRGMVLHIMVGSNWISYIYEKVEGGGSAKTKSHATVNKRTGGGEMILLL